MRAAVSGGVGLNTVLIGNAPVGCASRMVSTTDRSRSRGAVSPVLQRYRLASPKPGSLCDVVWAEGDAAGSGYVFW